MAIATLSQLRSLIGAHVHFSGMKWEVIEIIEQGPELVLQSEGEGADGHIQSNQYGDAHRRVPQTLSIPVIDPNSGEFHAMFIEAGLHDHLKSLDGH